MSILDRIKHKTNKNESGSGSAFIVRPCKKSNPSDDPVIIERWNGKGWSEVEVTHDWYKSFIRERGHVANERSTLD